MSYQEKKNYVSLISTILIFGAYCIYVFLKYETEIVNSTASLRFWGTVILVLIPVSIVANIVITMGFNIFYRIKYKEAEPSFTDELDQVIELRSTRISHYVFVLGFLLAMVSLALEWPLSVTFIILIFSGFVSEVVGVSSQLYFYRRGV